MHEAPPDIPFHRVVDRRGKLTDAFLPERKAPSGCCTTCDDSRVTAVYMGRPTPERGKPLRYSLRTGPDIRWENTI